jgi:hypothetical protein
MNDVVITDIKMPVWSMVTFMVKWSFAAIPAIIIIGTVIALFARVMGGMLDLNTQ